jgi:hypothetical protein
MRLGRRSFLRALLGVAAWLLAPVRRAAAESLLTAAQSAQLARYAAVIVPAWNGQPAAGGAEFTARFERLALAHAAPESYRRQFERFAAEVERRAPGLEPDAVAALFEGWHAEWRREARPGFEATFFEYLRRDVLRAHYASAAGWRALGWSGPAHRAAPTA